MNETNPSVLEFLNYLYNDFGFEEDDARIIMDWIYYGNIAALNTGRTKYEEAELSGLHPIMNDFKPKFILKVDGKAVYLHAQNVINTFRDLDLNNLNFITSAEKAPK